MAKFICQRCSQITLTLRGETEIVCPVCGSEVEENSGKESK